MKLLNRSKQSPVIFIAVDGKGGAGKSTLAEKLATELQTSVIHTDDFTTFDVPAFDGADLVVEEVFTPIVRGARRLSYDRLQVWPGEPDHIGDQVINELMIIEGCGVSCQKFQPYLSYVITVDLDDETRIARIIERDVDEGGRDSAENEVIGKLWEEKENEYFLNDNPLNRSDVVVRSDKSFDVAAVLSELDRL